MRTLILCFLFALPYTVFSQERLVFSGMITDAETGIAIQGAVVSLQKSNISALTNPEGRYRLLIKRSDTDDTLSVRYIGYEPFNQSVSLARGGHFDINLERKNTILEEVEINTGYQTQKRRSSTGSVELISKEELGYGTGANLLDRIEGLFSGATFDRTNYNFNGIPQQPDLTVRGASSLMAETFPLIVVDNFPFEGALEDINPDDIENITILKDAAASSIWGVKAGNGVLVITTKKGKLNQPLTIDVGTNLMVGGKPDLFSEQIVSAADFIEMETFLFDNGFYTNQINDSRKPPLSPVIHLLLQHERNEIDRAELEKQFGILRNRDVRNDFLKHVYRNPVESNTTFNMRGGGDKTTYSFTLGHNSNLYNMPMNARKRLTARYNQSYRPIDNLSISTDLAYTYLTTSQYNSSNMIGYNQMLVNGKKLYPYAQLRDALGENAVLYKDYDKSFIADNQSKVMRDWSFRPLDEMNNYGSKLQRDQIVAGLNLDYEFVKGVRFSVNSQFNRAISESSSYYEEESYFTRNIFNRFTYVSDSEIENNVPKGGIMDKDNTKLWGYAFRSQLSASRTFGDRHSFEGLLGAEVREVNNSGDQRRNYGVYEDRNIYELVDFTATKRIFPVLGNRAFIPNRIGFGRTSNRFVSFYSNFNYSLDERYYLSLSVRNDASNIFGVEMKNKWSPLWSVGGAWEVSRESFFKSNLIDYFKLRASFGYSGNVDSQIPAELVLQRVSYLDFYTNLPFNSIVSLQNPELRWEKVRTFNIAADWRMLNNQLAITIDYYRKKSMDLLGPAIVDPTLGVSAVTMNSAQLMGQGLDLSISANVRSGTWGWNGTIRAGYNKTTLDKYFARPQTVTSNAINAADFVGKEYKVLTSLKWHGLTEDSGSPIGYIGEEPSTAYLDILRNTPLDELVYHGSSIPRTSLLLRNTLKYKSWELGFTFSGQFFYFFRRNSIDYGQFFNRWEGHADFANRWRKPGDEKTTNIPAFNYPVDTNREGFYALSEILVRRGDHLRLQDIRVAYRAAINNRKMGVRNIELFMMASNLGLIWTKNAEGIDPVYDSGIGPSRTITGGLKVGF